MHPITYSLIINLVALLGAVALAFHFAAPWLILVVIVLQTHAIQRFDESSQRGYEDEDESKPIGFTAQID